MAMHNQLSGRAARASCGLPARYSPPDLPVAHRLRYRTERTQGQALRKVSRLQWTLIYETWLWYEYTVADSAPTLYNTRHRI